MEDLVAETVKLNPQHSLVHSVLGVVLAEGNQDTPGQIIADVTMALTILCVALDADPKDIAGLVNAAMPNAEKAAAVLIGEVED